MDKNVALSYYEENTRDHRTRYVADVTHLRYGEHKIIKDYDYSIVRHKVDDLIKKWQSRDELAEGAESARLQTLEIRELNQNIENILIDGLFQCNDVFGYYRQKLDSQLLKLKEAINEVKVLQRKLKRPTLPVLVTKQYPDEPIEFEPLKSDFIVAYKNIYTLFPFLKARAQKKKDKEFEMQKLIEKLSYAKKKKAYESLCNSIDTENKYAKKQYDKNMSAYFENRDEYEAEHSQLTKALDDYQQEHNDKNRCNALEVESLQYRLQARENKAIEDYCALLLESSQYPIEIDKNIIVSYNSDLLAIDYSLPSIDTFPSLAEVKFSKGSYVPVLMTERAFSKHYDDALYKIVLRSLHEVFADTHLNSVNSVAFNGWVTTLNKASGKTETGCIMSVKTNREQIADIDFMNVNPKACFKYLKGIASSQLSTITAIQPIVVLNKSDKRFVEHYSVGEELDNSTNLASMHWEDFEHLIRELFEQEFSYNGGEVKVTQASRDGGVDAIAFDPDPIRGGKIVIQAKRYTNTVGVSAVRDLYGTVLNEGATKGILVTTSDYGGDSYEFAKDKPITLMNGANLLYLLEKHGQHARIDINEARKLMANEYR